MVRLKHRFSLLGEYHRALLLAKELRKDEKLLYRVQQRIYKKYNEHVINKLNEWLERKTRGASAEKIQRYQQQYEHKLKELAHKFLKDFNEMIDLNTIVFEVLDNIVRFDDVEEHKDLVLLTQLFDKAAEYKHPFIFTEEAIEKFTEETVSYEKMVFDDVKRDVRNDRREKHEHAPKKLGFLRMHRSDKSLAKQILKADKKLSKETNETQLMSKELLRQLEQGVSPNFLDLFRKYIEIMGTVEKIIVLIREDTRALVVHHVKEQNKSTQLTNYFFGLILTKIQELGIPNDLVEKVKHFEENVGKKAIAYANKELRAERQLYRDVVSNNSKREEFIQTLKSHRAELMKYGAAA